MKIKKLKHCCMVMDIDTAQDKVRVMTDPGFYSVEKHDKIKDIDIVLITHEHADHFHVDSLKAMVKNNPNIIVITNDTVGEMLAKEGVEHRVMKAGESVDVRGVHIDSYGEKHALLHKSIPLSSNVGFFIENKFFFPGDALTDPKRPIHVLAAPVAGPWIKMSEGIDYILDLKPHVAFPVHDAMRLPSQHLMYQKILSGSGIEFRVIEEDGELDID